MYSFSIYIFIFIRNLLTDRVTAIGDYNVKLATVLLQELKTIAYVKRDFRMIQPDTHRRQVFFRYFQHFWIDLDLHDPFHLWMFSYFASNSAISTSNYQNLTETKTQRITGLSQFLIGIKKKNARNN